MARRQCCPSWPQWSCGVWAATRSCCLLIVFVSTVSSYRGHGVAGESLHPAPIAIVDEEPLAVSERIIECVRARLPSCHLS